MGKMGLVTLVLFAFAATASADKVAWLLENSGEASANMQIGDGQPPGGYSGTFSDPGPFYPSDTTSFLSPEISGTQLNASFYVGDNVIPSTFSFFLVQLGTSRSSEATLSYSGSASLDTNFRFVIGDEPISAVSGQLHGYRPTWADDEYAL